MLCVAPSVERVWLRAPASPCRRRLALLQAVIEEAFRGLHGRTLNFNSMLRAVGQLNRWYEDKGVLGQVGSGGVGGARGLAPAQRSAMGRQHVCKQPWSCPGQ